ncbi:hypothetical protein M0R19_04130 [Candidatus Pacearchaeota archaeon]|jgi:hypothetical protein|nr:hypothetical protein [Candidatus Pacearchaeota archaeon]
MTIFKANNNLDSISSFYFRGLYDKFAYPTYNENPISLRENDLYGKVDNYGNVIIPNKEMLRQVESENKSLVFTFDFVVRAYDLMREYFKRARTTRMIRSKEEGSVLSDIKVKNGWIDPNIEYNKHVISIFSNYNKFYLIKGRKNKIVTFDDYVEQFILIFSHLAKSFLITKSAFYKSSYVSYNATGLILDIGGLEQGDDKNATTYINDPNYSFYMEAARRFGFKIDKHSPWLLVADLTSPGMLMNFVPGVSMNNFFSIYYNRIMDDEIFDLKKVFIYGYNEFKKVFPWTDKIKSCSDVTRIQKKEVNKDQYDMLYWIKVYFYIRSCEENVAWRQQNYDSNLLKAIELYEHFNYIEAIKYINEKLRISKKLSSESFQKFQHRW